MVVVPAGVRWRLDHRWFPAVRCREPWPPLCRDRHRVHSWVTGPLPLHAAPLPFVIRRKRDWLTLSTSNHRVSDLAGHSTIVRRVAPLFHQTATCQGQVMR